MFDSSKTPPGRLTDAVDLLIDFATLGEYGLEPRSEPHKPCEARRRTAVTRARSTGAWSSAVERFATQV